MPIKDEIEKTTCIITHLLGPKDLNSDLRYQISAVEIGQS